MNSRDAMNLDLAVNAAPLLDRLRPRTVASRADLPDAVDGDLVYVQDEDTVLIAADGGWFDAKETE